MGRGLPRSLVVFFGRAPFAFDTVKAPARFFGIAFFFEAPRVQRPGKGLIRGYPVVARGAEKRPGYFHHTTLSVRIQKPEGGNVF